MTVAGYAGMLATLAFVLGLVLLVAKLARRFLPGTVHAAGSNAFTVVQRIPLGQRQGIAVVQRGDTLIGVSVGEGGVRTLFTMPVGDGVVTGDALGLEDDAPDAVLHDLAGALDGDGALRFPGIAASTRAGGMPFATAFGRVLRDTLGAKVARLLLVGLGTLVAGSLQAQQPAARPVAPVARPAGTAAPTTAPTTPPPPTRPGAAAGAGAAPSGATPGLRPVPPAAAQPGPRDLPQRIGAQVPVPKPSTPAPTASKSGGVATQAPNLPAAQARDIAALQQRANGNPPLTTPEAQAIAGRADSMLKKFSPQMDLKVGGNVAGEGLRLSGTVGIVVMMGLLSLLPMLVLMMTGFTRILVVLHFLKQALGTQSAPPGQLLAAMALLLSGFVMGPTLSEVNKTALEPWMDGKIEQVEMMSRAVTPFKAFMVRQVREQDLQTFVDLADIPQPESREAVPLTILMSAFVTSELRTAFQIGFALFLPFIVIDVVVGSVLMSMGMVMLPPAMISMPFKLLLFVLVDGWGLVITGLVQSFPLMTAAPVALPDLLTTAGAATFILLVARVGGLLLIAPVFTSKSVPMQLRTAVMLLFAVVLVPVAKAHLQGAPALTPLAFCSETLIGFGLGLGSAMVIGAASAAGDMMSVQMGLAGASVLDPMTNIQVPVLGQFMTAFVTLLLLSSGGHLVMIDGLGASLEALPLGMTPDIGSGMLAMAKLGGELISLGVMFAAPVMGATMLANVALAILTRAAPQLQIITVAFPLQIATGLFTLAAALSLTAVWFGGWADFHEGLLVRLLGPLLQPVR